MRNVDRLGDAFRNLDRNALRLPDNWSIVTIAGMPQAGSTLCYNLVRLILRQAGETVAHYLQDEPDMTIEEGSEQRVFILVKQHNLPTTSPLHRDNNGAEIKPSDSIYINICRDLRDTVASAIRKGSPREDLGELCSRNIQWHYDFEHLADYEWVYEQYKSTPIKVVTQLAKTLGYDTDESVASAVMQGAESLKSLLGSPIMEEEEFGRAFYRTTRLESTQITNQGKIGGYKDTLTPEEINYIEREHGDWLRSHGYLS